MENIEEQILSYPHLSTEKKRTVEAYVENHPEWAPLLQDVRSLEVLTSPPPAASAEFPSDALVATYVVVRHLHAGPTPEALADALSRLDDKIERSPALQDRVDAARERLEAAEAAVDPVSQFEDLTGHDLDPAADPDEHPSSLARESAADQGADRSRPSLLDRLLHLPLGLRWGGAAIALLLGTYAVLFSVSEASQSALDRLATVDPSTQIVDNYSATTTRSAAPASDTLTVDQLYVDALSILQAARTSTLGLFPSYDAEKLDRAESLLERVLDETASGSFLSLEAHFYLGKVHLAQERVEVARSHFKTVVEREGRLTQEALRILERLQETHPVGPSNTG